MKTSLLVLVIMGVIGFGVPGVAAEATSSEVARGTGGAWEGGSGGFVQDDCKIVGAAALDSDDYVAGSAVNLPGGADTGLWVLRLANGDVFVGRSTFVHCRRDGGGGPSLNVGELEGVGWLNGVRGYEFSVSLHDHGDGPPTNLQDDFIITIAKDATFIRAGGLVRCGGITITDLSPS